MANTATLATKLYRVLLAIKLA